MTNICKNITLTGQLLTKNIKSSNFYIITEGVENEWSIKRKANLNWIGFTL